MSKDAYFDMCTQLNSSPLEEEIPLEVSDFPYEIIQAWQCYSRLPSKIDSFSGEVLGKDLTMLPTLFDLMGIVEDRLTVLDFVVLIDNTDKLVLQQRKAGGKKKTGKS